METSQIVYNIEISPYNKNHDKFEPPIINPYGFTFRKGDPVPSSTQNLSLVNVPKLV